MQKILLYLVYATGFRTADAFNDQSQNVNNVVYKNHIFNTAGNPNLKTSLVKQKLVQPKVECQVFLVLQIVRC